MAWNCSASCTGKNSIHTPGKPSDDWPRYLTSPGTACYHPSLHRCGNVLFTAISLTSSSPQDLISLAWGEGGAGQCFWLLSFPAQGEKDRAKGSDTFPSPLPGSARAVEMKHGVQVDDTTSKREPASQPAVPVPGRDPMKVCVARARTVVSPSFRGRRSCGCHPPPLTRRAPSPAYGA